MTSQKVQEVQMMLHRALFDFSICPSVFSMFHEVSVITFT